MDQKKLKTCLGYYSWFFIHHSVSDCWVISPTSIVTSVEHEQVYDSSSRPPRRHNLFVATSISMLRSTHKQPTTTRLRERKAKCHVCSRNSPTLFIMLRKRNVLVFAKSTRDNIVENGYSLVALIYSLGNDSGNRVEIKWMNEIIKWTNNGPFVPASLTTLRICCCCHWRSPKIR